MSNTTIVNSESSLDKHIKDITVFWNKEKFLTVKVTGGKRSLDQNAMNFELYTRIGEALYGGDTEFARRECKLNIGCDILRRDDHEFALFYGQAFSDLHYSQKLIAIKFVDITKRMNRKQNTEYISKVMDVYTLKGVDFTEVM